MILYRAHSIVKNTSSLVFSKTLHIPHGHGPSVELLAKHRQQEVIDH